MKKYLSYFIVVVLLFSFVSSIAYATQEEKFDIVKAKKELMEKAENSTKRITKKSQDEIDYILARMTSEGVNQDVIAKEVEKYGIYKLEIPNEVKGDYVNSLSTDNTDVTMTDPAVYYDYNKKQWVVVGGGYWHSNDWLQYVPAIWTGGGHEGSTVDVGGRDGFGLGYTNTSGTYNTLVKSVYAYISDGLGNESYTKNRSDGDGRKGIGFEIQDKLRARKKVGTYWPPDTSEFSYIGKHFAGLARYNSNFANYDGIATTYYIHTYESASIQSVDFGVQGQSAGVKATLINKQYSFPAYSDDTGF